MVSTESIIFQSKCNRFDLIPSPVDSESELPPLDFVESLDQPMDTPITNIGLI